MAVFLMDNLNWKIILKFLFLPLLMNASALKFSRESLKLFLEIQM